MSAQHSAVAQELATDFARRFGAAPSVICRAPGRVNLIGEHTDYNDGFVLPAAIEMSTWAAAGARVGGHFSAQSQDLSETCDASLEAPFQRQGNWTDYARGVAVALREAGVPLGGVSVLVHGDVPVGAGLSSSAALEVSVAASLLAVAGTRMPLEQVARLCQRAENEFVGAPCGIMDQFVAALGRAGQALFLDCRNLHYEYVPLPEGVSLVLCNSMVKHSVATGEYGVRRRQCEEAVRLLSRELPGITALRDVSCRELQERAQHLPALLLKRARHVISDNQRVQDTVEALRRGNLAKVGELMEASHASMRDDFEISCPEIDVLVELAQQQPATIGTRMTGGGFGGCTVNLVRADGVDSFRSAIHEGYTRRVGREPQIYVTQAGDGVERIL